MQFLSSLVGDNKALLFGLAVLVAIVVFAVILVAYRIVFGRRLRLPGGSANRGRQLRLGVVDAFDLDRQRQLVLVRRDNVEHLIMVGGPNDVVIETQIVRAQPLGAREGPSGEAAGRPAAQGSPDQPRPAIRPVPVSADAGGRPPVPVPPAALAGATSVAGRPGSEPRTSDRPPPRPSVVPAPPPRPNVAQTAPVPAAKKASGAAPATVPPAVPPRPTPSKPAPAPGPTPPAPAAPVPAAAASAKPAAPPPVVPTPPPSPSTPAAKPALAGATAQAMRSPPSAVQRAAPAPASTSNRSPGAEEPIDSFGSLEEEMAKLLGRPLKPDGE